MKIKVKVNDFGLFFDGFCDRGFGSVYLFVFIVSLSFVCVRYDFRFGDIVVSVFIF